MVMELHRWSGSEPAGALPGSFGLDLQAISGIVDAAGAEALRELVADYAAQARRSTWRMRDAIDRGDARTLASLAHLLKASSQGVGAVAAGETLLRLERIGRYGDVFGAAALLDVLERQLHDALRVLWVVAA